MLLLHHLFSSQARSRVFAKFTIQRCPLTIKPDAQEDHQAKETCMGSDSFSLLDFIAGDSLGHLLDSMVGEECAVFPKESPSGDIFSSIQSMLTTYTSTLYGIVRDRPVPIPGSGMQLTNISHVRDLSSMLSLAVGNPAAANGQIFNCVSDRAVTLDGMARLCAQAAGRPLKIVHYDPKAVGIDAKKAFPFRNMHFYAEPRVAKESLGWTSATNLPEDLKERFDEYVKIGRDKKQMQFDIDDKILESFKVPVGV